MQHCPSLFVCNFNSSFCLDDDGNVWEIGRDIQSKSAKSICTSPVKIGGLINIAQISCGFHHLVACDSDGNLFTIGAINKGLKRKPNICKPKKIKIPPILYISSGSNFIMCITYEGYVWGFGENDYKQLGIPNRKVRSPQLVPDIENAISIECGEKFSICTTSEGIFSWGKVFYNSENLKLIQQTPCIINSLPDDIISIKCGLSHALLLTREGNVYGIGNNLQGQLGMGDIKIIDTPTLITSSIKQISCGYDSSLLIDENNNLWVMGYNQYGQLGIGEGTRITKPQKNKNIKDIKDLSTGGYHSFIRKYNDQIYGFGENEQNQLGVPEENTRRKIRNLPIRLFNNKENIWGIQIKNSRAKSANK